MSAAKKREDESSVIDLGIEDLLEKDSVVVAQEVISDDSSQWLEWSKLKGEDNYAQLAELTASYNFAEEKFDATEIFTPATSIESDINEYVVKLLARSYWIWAQAYLQELPIFVLLAPYEGLMRDVMQLIDNKEFYDPEDAKFFCSEITEQLYKEAVGTLKESIEKISSFAELETDLSQDYENVHALVKLFSTSESGEVLKKDSTENPVSDIALRPEQITPEIYEPSSLGDNKGRVLILSCLFVVFLLGGFWASREIKGFLAKSNSPKLASVGIKDLGIEMPNDAATDKLLKPRRSEVDALDSIIYRIGDGTKPSEVAPELNNKIDRDLSKRVSLAETLKEGQGVSDLSLDSSSTKSPGSEKKRDDNTLTGESDASKGAVIVVKKESVGSTVKPLKLTVEKIPQDLLKADPPEVKEPLTKKLPSPFLRREVQQNAGSSSISTNEVVSDGESTRAEVSDAGDFSTKPRSHYMVVLERTPVKNGINGSIVTTLYPGDRVQVESYQGNYAKIMAKSGRYGYILKKHLSKRNDFAR